MEEEEEEGWLHGWGVGCGVEVCWSWCGGPRKAVICSRLSLKRTGFVTPYMSS